MSILHQIYADEAISSYSENQLQTLIIVEIMRIINILIIRSDPALVHFDCVESLA